MWQVLATALIAAAAVAAPPAAAPTTPAPAQSSQQQQNKPPNWRCFVRDALAMQQGRPVKIAYAPDTDLNPPGCRKTDCRRLLDITF
jgi:hypothetical protein